MLALLDRAFCALVHRDHRVAMEIHLARACRFGVCRLDQLARCRGCWTVCPRRAYLGGRIVEGFLNKSPLRRVPTLLGYGNRSVWPPVGCDRSESLWVGNASLVGDVAWPTTTGNLRMGAARQSTDPIFWPWVGLLAVAAFSLVATQKRRRDWVQIAILGLVAWQSASHLRHISPSWQSCAGFGCPSILQSALAQTAASQHQSHWESCDFRPGLRRRGNHCCCSWPASGCRECFVAGQTTGTDLPVDRSFYPVDAIEFMAEHR